MTAPFPAPVLVTGATGYVGGRLVPLLLDQGWRVRPAARSLDKLNCRPWAGHPACAPVRLDTLDPSSLDAALQGCQAAYYLVHSMSSAGRDFASADDTSARNFAAACARARVGRIIYLGGLGQDSPELSHHLRSRLRTAQILAEGVTPVTYLRAAVILGAGSASYEILRSLTERLPVMLTPRWVRTRCQPISIRDVLAYLSGCLSRPETVGQTYDIGGPDILTYRDLFQLYAEVAGLRRRIIIPVPALTPRLSAHWVRLITPVPPSVSYPLIDGLRNEVICKDNRIRDILPITLQSCRETFQAARREIKDRLVPTCWSDAGQVNAPEWLICGDAPYAGGEVLEMAFRTILDSPPERVWPAIESIGGTRGWYFADPLWKIRGGLDRLLGGMGLAVGRRDPGHLQTGDALDCWRVHRSEPPHRLELVATMKSPGEAALVLSLKHHGQDAGELIIRARFQPRGLAGLAYWWGLWLPHLLLFRGLSRGVARESGAALIRGPERIGPERSGGCALPGPGKG